MIRRISVVALFISLILCGGVARPQDNPALLEATAIVTGTREATRAEGFAHARGVVHRLTDRPGELERDAGAA